MSDESAISQQVARESSRRARLAAPAVGGGIVYLLGAIVLNAALSGLPAVGIVQGLTPALSGRAAVAVSPRAAEVTFLDKHAFGLVAASALTAIAVLAIVLVLLFIVDATRFRRPETWPLARPAVLVGGVAFALLNVVHWAAIVLQAHKFSTGHDFSGKAVDHALLRSGGLGVTLQALGLFVALALAVGTIAAMVAAMRAGLLPRWLAVLGIFSGLLFLPLFGSSTFELIPAFWMVATGFLLMGRLPGGDPPAWAAGEARPWPSAAEMREQREAHAEPAPEPAMPRSSGSGARRRKRGRGR